MRLGTVFEHGSLVICDRKIAASSGVNFYRAKGTDGWVFDKRDGRDMMTLQRTKPKSDQSRTGWTPEFVRGAASAIGGLTEIDFNEASRMLSFSKEEEYSTIRINVYYTTQTIGTAMNHPKQGRTQVFRRNCTTTELSEILKNPRMHSGHGYHNKRKIARIDKELEIDPEVELRNSLADVGDSIAALLKRRRRLVDDIGLGQVFFVMAGQIVVAKIR